MDVLAGFGRKMQVCKQPIQSCTTTEDTKCVRVMRHLINPVYLQLLRNVGCYACHLALALWAHFAPSAVISVRQT